MTWGAGGPPTLTRSVPSAADHLKLHFPMCFAASNLAWGFIEFQDVSALSALTPCAPRWHAPWE